MVKLFNKKWTKSELEARVGRIEQIAGLQRLNMKDGPEDGLDVIRVRTGSGLSYWVTPGKGLDIALTEYKGININWSSSNGDVNSVYYDDRKDAWIKTASGGLLMTCGLSQVGKPGKDEYGQYGMHGRAHHTPARQVSYSGSWIEDEYVMSISGTIEETSIFGHSLKLTRKISSVLGKNTISIDDTVENKGFQKSPHMMLYHFNLGFPFLDRQSLIEMPKGKVSTRDSSMKLDDISKWEEPIHNFEEQVFYHEPEKTEDNNLSVRVISPNFPIPGRRGAVFELKWDMESLPKFVQWRMPGEKDHVLGLEPANCWTNGREEEKNNNSLKFLEPGESIQYHLEISMNEFI